MPSFLEALSSCRVLLMDGAMGTELQRAGVGVGECHERWNLIHADRVAAIHRAYVEVGSEVLLTNTFQSNPLHLSRFGVEDRLEEINRYAVWIARTAAGPSRFVLGDIGPIFDSTGRAEFADCKQLARILNSLEDVDGILFETCSHPRVLSAVQYAFHRLIEIETPLLLSLTYHRPLGGDLVTFSGHSPETFARHAERHGVTALGVNCGRDIDMDDIIEIIRRYRNETDLPLFARPNAGMPTKKGKGWIYPNTAQTMAARLPDLVAAGASMVGGCCGTTPEYIAAFRTVLPKYRGEGRPGQTPTQAS